MMKFSKALTVLAALSYSVSAIEVIDDNGNNNPTPFGEVKSDHHHHDDDVFTSFLLSQSEHDHMKALIPILLKARDIFLQWAMEFGREYESLEEELKRMKIWVQNHEFIEIHNTKTPKPSYTVGHNDYSDMTNEEFREHFSLGQYSPGVDAILEAQQKAKESAAMHRLNGEEHPLQAEFRYLREQAATPASRRLEGFQGWFDDQWFNEDDDSDKGKTDDDDKPKPDDNDTNGLPDEVDWVKAGAVTPPKNQGRCGSCWAFSTTGSIEGAMFVKHGTLVSLSEQNLIDCDHTEKGCEGGLMETAFKFDESAKGICSESDYPYIAKDDQLCRTNCTKVEGSAVHDYIDIDEKDKHGLLASLVMQPTSIAMQAGQLSFQFYKSGVYSEESCGADGNVDHGVLAVGYGTDSESGKKYFNVKNSWGPSWGEKGFFRLDRMSKHEYGTCAILRIMTAPIME